MSPERLAAALGVLSGACAAPEAATEASDARTPACEALVDLHPDALDFGQVPLDAPAPRGWVSLFNDGDCALRVDEVSVSTEGGGEAFALAEAPPEVLAPGGELGLPIELIAEAPGRYAGRLVVLTNDLSLPVIAAELRAERVAPAGELILGPEVVAFGEVLLGCAAEAPIALGNAGTAPLTVTALSFEHPDSGVSFDAQPPLTLAPGELRTWPLRFTPTQALPSQDQLSVEVDGEAAAPGVQALGVGVAGEEQRTFHRGDGRTLSFPLLQPAVPFSLAVSIDNIALNEGWSVAAGGEGVRFERAPEPGSWIELAYLRQPSCP